MALEAAKEMDRRCVMNWLNEVYVTPSRAFDEYTEYELKMFAHDALVLLKEQEPVEAIDIIDEKYPVGDNNRYKGYRCGKCKEVIPWDANYCLYCGRKVKWDD